VRKETKPIQKGENKNDPSSLGKKKSVPHLSIGGESKKKGETIPASAIPVRGLERKKKKGERKRKI